MNQQKTYFLGFEENRAGKHFHKSYNVCNVISSIDIIQSLFLIKSTFLGFLSYHPTPFYFTTDSSNLLS
jgi:hypothetical protein